MQTVHQIVKRIGSAKIEAACDVSSHSVRAAKSGNLFPASWFNEVERLCAECDIECPRALFNFKGSAQ